MEASDQIVNLRNQAENAAREERLYAKRHPAWISWEDVQTTRLNVLRAWEAISSSAPIHVKQKMLSDVLVILFHSITPPEYTLRQRLERSCHSARAEPPHAVCCTQQSRRCHPSIAARPHVD